MFSKLFPDNFNINHCLTMRENISHHYNGGGRFIGLLYFDLWFSGTEKRI